MTTIAEALIEVRADTSRVASDVERGASTASKSGGKFGKVFAGAFAAGAGALLAGGAFLKDAFGEAEEAKKVGAITANAIKATGGAAGVTAKQVGDMAGRLSAVTGIDDEASQSGSNVLLTFKNVKNYVDGEFVGVFDRANAAAVDLSAAGFGSIESGSKMLGKALNDPVAGITALSRAGVTFSEGQKKTIARLVETGKAAEAQGLILDEVESQVGGAGAAQATAADKAKVAWGNLKEQVGTALMPTMNRFFTFLTDTGIPALSDLGGYFGKVGEYVGPIIAKGKELFATFKGSGEFDKLKATVLEVFESVKSIIRDGVSIVKSIWAAFGEDFTRLAKTYFTTVLGMIRGVWQVIRGIFRTFAALLKGDWKGVWEGLKMILKGAWGFIKSIVKWGWELVKLQFKIFGGVIRGIFSALWDGLKSMVSRAWDGIKSLVGRGVDGVVNLVKSIPGKLSSIGGKMLDAGKGIIGSLFEGLKSAAGSAGSFVSGLVQTIKDAVNNALNLPITLGKGPLKFTIPAFARGTNYAPGGVALVGEEGPELVNLPRGSKVATAARTKALARRVGGGAAGAAAAAAIGLLTITNWEEGTGYFRVIAADEVDDAADFDDELGRMGR